MYVCMYVCIYTESASLCSDKQARYFSPNLSLQDVGICKCNLLCTLIVFVMSTIFSS